MIDRHRLTPTEKEKIINDMQIQETGKKTPYPDDTKAYESQKPNIVFSDKDISDTAPHISDSGTTKEDKPHKNRKKRKVQHRKNMFLSDDVEEEASINTVSYDTVITMPKIEQTTAKEQTKKQPPFSDTVSNIKAEEFILELRRPKASEESDKYENKKSAPKNKDRLRYAFIVVCIAVFIGCIFMIALGFVSGKSAQSLYSELQSDFLDGLNINSETPTSPGVIRSIATPPFGAERNNESNMLIAPNNELYSQIRAKLTSYKNSNKDIYGWIAVEGTNINYVVLKGDDNSYYLDHTYNKAYNPLGAIFVDFRCLSNAIDNKNLVVYGHFASYYKQMFYEVSKFLDKDFFDKNKTITMYTLDGVLTYEIFAIYETDATYHYVNPYFATDREFEEWANEIKNNSLYVRDSEPLSVSDRIITLSTCTNGLASRRYALHARLVNIEY